jgi:type II secretory ATPase GspE/PulE/Tfp pilus assembly ATPase PilB-like protein
VQGLQGGVRPDQEEFAELMEELRLEYWDSLGHPLLPEFKLYRPKGCPKCTNTGYKGRMGIHELLVATDEMKRKIQKRESIEELRKQAMRDGMTTLLQDGIQKVVRAITDFKQVRAVCIKVEERRPSLPFGQRGTISTRSECPAKSSGFRVYRG